MDKFFAVFGKLILVVLAVGAVAGGAYFYGQKKNVSNPTSTSPASPSATTSATPVPTKTVEGGVPKSAGLSFDLYSLEVPVDWNVGRETSQAYEKLTISKGANQITIMQGATGGAMCLYPGDPDFEGPSSHYTTFAELKTKDGTLLRRSGTDEAAYQGKFGFTACQKNSEGDFGQPTSYGHIGYSVPAVFDKEVLLEMDAMISSLKKK